MDELYYKINNIDSSAKKRFIRQLFDSIVLTYDLLNRILSFGIDILWRRSAIKIIGGLKKKEVLDLCCGTGDLSRILCKNGANVFSLDFSLTMILAGIRKKWILGPSIIADASILPFKNDSFQILTISFGIRNIPDIDNFIAEAIRVLKKEGMLVILELTRPDNWLIGVIYQFYLRELIPRIGGLISGKRFAYRYLSGTVSSFIDPENLGKMLKSGGFTKLESYRKTFGVATVIIGKK